MKPLSKNLKALALAITGGVFSAASGADDHKHEQVLYPIGSLNTFTGPENLFTGEVNVEMVFPPTDTTEYSGAYVTFQPGARTNWHEHPAGQHMIVMDGIALTGTREGKVYEFSKGESVWCPQDVDHWHGATKHSPMTHLVVTNSKDGENVIWKEKVTDEQYSIKSVNALDIELNELDAKEIALVKISSFAASGNQTSLRNAVAEGLDAGLTVNEVKEIQVHLYAYTGFPRALNALGTSLQLIQERKAKGIKDIIGEEPTAIPEGKSSQVIGEKVQTDLVGAPVKAPLFDFAPGMNTYLQSHLFGDIFARGVLDFKTREMVTVAGLASIDGVESQLRSHIRMSTNAGVTAEELSEIATVLSMSVGKKQGLRVVEAMAEVLKP